MAFNYDGGSATQEQITNLVTLAQDLVSGNPNFVSDLTSVLNNNPTVDTGVVSNGQVTSSSGSAPGVLMVNSGGALVIDPSIMGSTPVYLFNTDEDVSVGFNTIERTILLGGGDDFVAVAGDHNTTLAGGAGNDTLVTSGGDDLVAGDAGNDSIATGAGNDTIVAGDGNDTIDGGTGFDTLQINGDVGDFRFFDVGHGDLLVFDKADPTNSALVSDTEFLQFNSDTIVVVNNETDAEAMRLYDALLGRDADASGAEYWLGQIDSGVSLTDIANGFLASDEYTSDDLSNDEFVEMLYQNALGRASDAEGKAFWVDALDNGATQADVAIAIVGSAEAATAVDNVLIISGDQV